MVAPDWRDETIARIGNNSWRGIYTAFSIVGLVLIVWGFSRARVGSDILYVAPFWLLHMVILAMWVSLVLFAASSFPASYIKRIVKHPMVTGLIVWALAHLSINGDTASVLMFGSLLIWAIWNRVNVAKRDPGEPVVAHIKYDIFAVFAGTALWAAILFWLHGLLIGVEVIA